MKDKIQRIINEKGLNPGTFADSIGLQRAILYHILNGRNNASLDVVIRIHSRYPDIDTGWLLSPEIPADTPYIYVGANAATGSMSEQAAEHSSATNSSGADNQGAIQQELFPTTEHVLPVSGSGFNNPVQSSVNSPVQSPIHSPTQQSTVKSTAQAPEQVQLQSPAHAQLRRGSFVQNQADEMAENGEFRSVGGNDFENLNLKGADMGHFQSKKTENQPVNVPKSISEVILLYDDGTFKRLREC